MALPEFAVTNEKELIAAVRDKTSYDDSPDQWPTEQAKGNFEDAQRYMYAKTGSKDWFSEVAYGQAMVALTAMKAKGAVENINISSFGIGDEQLSFTNATEEDSQQLREWSSEVDEMLNKSDIEFESDPDLSISNTASYIG